VEGGFFLEHHSFSSQKIHVSDGVGKYKFRINTKICPCQSIGFALEHNMSDVVWKLNQENKSHPCQSMVLQHGMSEEGEN